MKQSMSFIAIVTVKNLPAVQKTWVQSLGQEDPQRKKWQPIPVFLPGTSHGQRNLVGYSPRGSQRVGHSWTTTTFTFFLELCFPVEYNLHHMHNLKFCHNHIKKLKGSYIFVTQYFIKLSVQHLINVKVLI